MVLRELIPSSSLTGIRLFFPDPWPKKRHHKRRFVQTGTLELMADRLVPGGVLHIATDHADYASGSPRSSRPRTPIVRTSSS